MPKIIYFSVFFIAALCTFCSEVKNDNTVKKLSFSVAEKIPVPEPSGLDLTSDETGFWVVSDENSTIYFIDSWGREVKNFKVDGEDLEGITTINDSTIAVVLERTREVVIIDTSGLELKRVKRELKGELNSGLEGITYDRNEKKFYILNEKKPRLLITLDENLNELKCDTLNFSKDVSGIFYDTHDKTLWILSDESQRIFKTDLSGKPIEEFKIKITQPEGITLNKARTKLYIISDKTGNLYVFNLDKDG
ncbi:MAG: SdiA-regulated domain-containing protein [Ignavibacteriaceae bacterium]|nr:SdiA-regulated domain-containing protein [Ignavibacteriaceae bacterium]